MTSPGYLVVTDIEESGDVINLFLNGAPLGTTSTPCIGCEYNNGDLAQILADPDFSNGEFALPAGVDTITGTWLGYIGEGDGALVVSSEELACEDCTLPATTPLPSTWAMLLTGLAGLGFFACRGTKKRSIGFAAA